tara:strand:+ start:346 stop:657 length:312 start_codon:yes stop_codon:yes gene_type:complete
MSVHYKSYNSSATSETIASRLYGIVIGGDNTPGASTNSISITVNGVDKLAVALPATFDSAAAGSGAPFTYWFNLANPSAGVPVSNFDITVAGTCTGTLLFEPA